MRAQTREIKEKLNDTCKTVVLEIAYKPWEPDYSPVKTGLNFKIHCKLETQKRLKNGKKNKSWL